ncbi:hypothetical protein D0869_12198 [Hortaea werneckii]|uniref:Uncharacterized protein n=1 Tax=Hortaea werneckii TaxID=91943 RepID=A0A3M7A3D2_HORWE|nr:hypothetical protein D0869_12198 [Hortaea werneckii]RMY21967.1 hypothetical protein D0867_03010 [Hortaea werneckii]RMY38956.1 hypothetical protein D0866_02244 [Hortaea werneckii]
MGPASRKRHQHKMAAQMEARQAKKAARAAKELGGKTSSDIPATSAAPIAAPVVTELLRERRLLEDEEEYQNRRPEGAQDEEQRSLSSDSGRSSLEDDLHDLAKPTAKPATRPAPTRKLSQSSRSESSKSTVKSGTWKRQRKKEVPYNQRHKRRWEDFIEDNDPIEGSMTFRRNARELDDRQEEPVVMDY